VADLFRAVAEALADPLDYPPLARATTPADQVVLALESGLPHAAELVAAVVDALVAAPVDPDGITVLRSRADEKAEADDPRRLLADSIRSRVGLATHQPEDRKELAYLAADDAGEPILLSRPLHEADLVVPIGCLHPESAAGYFGIHGMLYPGYSSVETAQRFRRPDVLDDGPAAKQSLTDQANQVAWLLGIHFAIQLLPGAGERVLGVLAGQSEAVARRGRQWYDETWTHRVPRPADLVVAAIEGGRGQQTWENVGRAIDAAVAVAEEDGAVAICCELAERPGPAMQQLAAAGLQPSAMRQINKDRPPDALVAASLARAADRCRVYLLSRLEAEVVEDLGMIHVESPEELKRLVSRHSTCTVLADAPRVVVRCEPG